MQHIASLSEQIAVERYKGRLPALLTPQIAEKQKEIDRYTSDRANLRLKGSSQDRDRFNNISSAFSAKETEIRNYSNRKLSFQSLKDEVANTRQAKAPEMLRQAKERHASSHLGDTQWDEFLLIFKGDVDSQLNSYMAWADGEILKLKGNSTVVTQPIPSDAIDFSSFSLLQLEQERNRLQLLLSADKVVSDLSLIHI